MRFRHLPLLAAAALSLAPAARPADPPPLKKGERIVFLGDSITAGGVRPTGYVTLVKNALAEKHKDLGVEVIGEKKPGTNSLDAKLDQYAEISRKVAKETGVPLCDLRKAFQDHLAKNNPDDKDKGVLTTDRVHLNDAGNKLVADTVLATIDK